MSNSEDIKILFHSEEWMSFTQFVSVGKKILSIKQNNLYTIYSHKPQSSNTWYNVQTPDHQLTISLVEYESAS